MEGALKTTVLVLPGVLGAHDTRGLSPPGLPSISLNSVAEKEKDRNKEDPMISFIVLTDITAGKFKN